MKTFLQKHKVWLLSIILVVILIVFFGYRIHLGSLSFGPIEISPPQINTEKPYVGVTAISVKNISKTNFIIDSVLQNTGTVPAREVKVVSVRRFGQTSIRQEELASAYLLPNTYAIYELRMTGSAFDEIDYADKAFFITLTVSYSDATTEKYETTVQAQYDPIDKAFSILSSDLR